MIWGLFEDSVTDPASKFFPDPKLVSVFVDAGRKRISNFKEGSESRNLD